MKSTAGQVLATLDTDTLRLDVERQRIRLRRAELGLERATALGADRFLQEINKLDVQLERLMLEQLETELAKSTLRSPIDGEVVFVTRVFPGEPIGARQTVVQVADPPTCCSPTAGSVTTSSPSAGRSPSTCAAPRIPAWS